MDAKAVQTQVEDAGLIDHRLVSLTDPSGAAAEQYRLLHHRIEKARAQRTLQVIALTSAAAGEGKSLTAANLAACAAKRGKKVVIVDCDLRRPRASRLFAVEEGEGLVSLLQGKGRLERVMRKGPEGLMVVPAGIGAEDPAGLFGGERFRQTIQSLRGDYEEIYLDLPPVLAFADTHVAASSADGVVMVIRSGSTPFQQVRDALDALAGTAIVGCVLTGCSESAAAYRKYYRRRA